MRSKFRPAAVYGAVLAVLLVAGPAAAQLSFYPLDQNIPLDAEGSLSVWLTEELEVRTIEVTVTFNSNILTGVAGAAGAAFQDLPCAVWDDYIPEQNQWYGFAVAIGADCFVTGPGELFVWNFLGEANGASEITAVDVRLYDRYGEEIPDVELWPTTVQVGDGTVGVFDLPDLAAPYITAVPNPFNPTTWIRFWLPEARTARLEVYDLKGRRVRTLLDGPVAARWNEVRWDGRTDSGSAAPSGVYLYRLDTAVEHLTGRVVLAR